MAIVQAYCQ